MKTPEQLKGAIKNLAIEKKLRPQVIMQIYLFERLIARLAVSRYRNNFILKGGLLISSMIGIANRSTLDMDATVTGINMDRESMISAISEIIGIDVGDGIRFRYERIEPIREDDENDNFRVSIKALFGKIDAPMKIDITTGDIITPSAIEYSYKSMFEENDLIVMAYNLETVLAEKYEAIIKRNIGTTRARDFYDLMILFNGRHKEINKDVFVKAVTNTAVKRGSLAIIKSSKSICEDIKKEPALERLWMKYQNENQYAKGISFEEVADNVLKVSDYLDIK